MPPPIVAAPSGGAEGPQAGELGRFLSEKKHRATAGVETQPHAEGVPPSRRPVSAGQQRPGSAAPGQPGAADARPGTAETAPRPQRPHPPKAGWGDVVELGNDSDDEILY